MTNLKQLATALTQGDYILLPEGDYSAYTDKQWASEAQAYLDGGDATDLMRMIAEGIGKLSYDTSAYLFSLRHGSKEFKPFSEWFDADYYGARAAESYSVEGMV